MPTRSRRRWRTGGVIALLLATLLVVAAGCGGHSAGSTAGHGRSLQALSFGGVHGQLIFGTGDYQPGRVRVTFLVLRPDGSLVERPQAHVWLATSGNSAPVAQTTARLESITAPGANVNAQGSSVLYI